MRIASTARICRSRSQGFLQECCRLGKISIKDEVFQRELCPRQLVIVGNRNTPKFKDITGINSENAITILLPKSSQFPVKLHSRVPIYSVPRHNGYIFFLGLAAGLFSLSSLWFLKFRGQTEQKPIFNYGNLTSVQPNLDATNLLTMDGNQTFESKPLLRNFENSKAHDEMPRCVLYQKNERVLHSNFVIPTKKPFGHPSIRPILRLPDLVKSRTIELDEYLIELFTRSSVSSTNASLNCTHFVNGCNQVCLLCWLCMPESWVFSPTLNSTFHPTSLGPLATSIHLLSLFIWSQLVCQAICLACICASSSSSIVKNDSHQSNNSSCRDSTLPKCSLYVSTTADDDDNDVVNGSRSIHKHPRSAGDGAPSTSTSNLKQLAELENNSSIQKSAEENVISLADANPSSQLEIRPLFYTHESDLPSTESKTIGNSSYEIHLPPDYIFSKTLNFLTNSETNPFSTDDSSFILRRLCSDPLLQKSSPVLTRNFKTLSTSHLKDSCRFNDNLSSSSALPSQPELEQLEYDELTSDMTQFYPHLELSDFSTKEQPLDELNDQDLHLIHLLDTLSSLLTMKPIEEHPNTNVTNESLEIPAPDSPHHPEFANLVRKATTLTEDLNGLEAVVDELHYKLKANQIELEQVEDNLDYMWHLRDHLDQSGSETSSSYASDKCDMEPNQDVEHDQELSNLAPCWSHELTIDCDNATPFTIDESSRVINHNSPLPNSYLSSREHSHSSLLTSSDPVESNPAHLTVPSPNFDYNPMTTSMPESHFGHHKFTTPSNQDRYYYYGSLKSTKSSRLSFRRQNHRVKSLYLHRESFVSDSSNRKYTSEILPDAEGFYHPDFIFEKDGIIDWSESELPKQQQQPIQPSS